MFSKKKIKKKKNGNLHCGNKIGDLQIICRTLNGFGFLSVTNYECLVGPSKYIYITGLELARVPRVPGTRQNSEHHLWHPLILRFLILTSTHGAHSM